MDAYHAAIRRLNSLGNLELPWQQTSVASLQDSLNRTKQLLARLGNPERDLRFVHVTGTSGKGSVTNLIHEILHASGQRVASYLSPHTTTYLERFMVGDKLLDPKVLVHAIAIVIAAYETHLREGKQALSHFELSTCVAFVAFTLAKVEWCVLEVGLGGRWDSTNVIPKKDAAVITNIDLDHTEILGPTYEDIAREKVGIISGRCTVISGEHKPAIRLMIKTQAASHKATVRFVDMPNNDHRLHNALIATAAAQAVGVPMKAIDQALATHRGLPCRFEVMQQHPLVIVDGAHNDAKMKATAHILEHMSQGSVHIIFGCREGKDAQAMLASLIPLASTIHTTRYQDGRGAPASPASLLNLIPKKQRGQEFLFADAALRHVLKTAKKGDTILVTGSLYLAGEVRTHWISEESILRKRSSQVANRKIL